MAKKWGRANPLYRWMLKRKRKARKGKKARTYSAPRRNRMGRRKGRKGRKGGRGISVSLTDVGYLATVLCQLEIPGAIREGQKNGISAGVEYIGKKFTVQDVVMLGLQTGVYGLVKKAMPSRKLFGIGSFSIRS